MSFDQKEFPISAERFDAVLFDMDGVLTATAKVHAVSWKKMFDEYLKVRSGRTGEPFRPFDVGPDYVHYVDGKLRNDGVQSFLKSRGIDLPWGDPDDPPESETVCALGNRKNKLVGEAIESEGVEVFPGAVALVKRLRQIPVRTAVVSASRNCRTLLQAAGIEDLFEVRVDGVVAEEMNLSGKPAPDTFLKAAELLGVAPARAVVIEDAVSGVQAGRAGGFGLVIGVDHKGNPDVLIEHGADIVVTDLGELIKEK
jgi:beta-phosphoglucomutase family hydrolase